MKSSSYEKIIEHLGTSRLEPYVKAAGRDEEKVLDLYHWGTQMTASIQEVLGITEVCLRNAVDVQLQKWNSNKLKQPGASWLLGDPAEPLCSITKDKRNEAKRRAQKSADRRLVNHFRYGQKMKDDDVLAHTTLDMWRDILPSYAVGVDIKKPENKNRLVLWNKAVKNAFPYADDPHGEKTYWRVSHVHDLRNRVSHMDSLLNIDILDVTENAFALVESIDPVLGNWLMSISTINAVYRKRPV